MFKSHLSWENQSYQGKEGGALKMYRRRECRTTGEKGKIVIKLRVEKQRASGALMYRGVSEKGTGRAFDLEGRKP